MSGRNKRGAILVMAGIGWLGASFCCSRAQEAESTSGNRDLVFYRSAGDSPTTAGSDTSDRPEEPVDEGAATPADPVRRDSE